MTDKIRVVVEVPRTEAKTEKEAAKYIRKRLELADQVDPPEATGGDYTYEWGDRVKSFGRYLGALEDKPVVLNLLVQMCNEIQKLRKGLLDNV